MPINEERVNMANDKKIRINTVAREYNVGVGTLVQFLSDKGIENLSPNAILDDKAYSLIEQEFGKSPAKKVNIKEKINLKPTVVSATNSVEEKPVDKANEPQKLKVLGKVDLDLINKKNQDFRSKPKENNRNEQQSKPTETVKAEPAKVETIAKPEPVKVEEKPVATKPAVEVKPEKVNLPKKEEVTRVEVMKEPVVEPVKVSKPQEVSATPQENMDEIRNKTYDQRQADDRSDVFRPNDNNQLTGPKVIGKVDLSLLEKKSDNKKGAADRDRKRKRIKKDTKVDLNNPKFTSGEGRPAGQGANRQGDKQNRPQQGTGANNQQRGGANKPGAQGGNRPAGQGGQNQGGQNRSQRPDNKRNNNNRNKGGNNRPISPVIKPEISDEEVQKQIKDTLARLTSKGSDNKRGAKHRKDKRDAATQRANQEMELQERERNTLKVTEFVTVSELAQMMEVQVTQVITACMNLGLMVSINQRLDAEALVVVAEEFNYKVEFVSVDIQEAIATDEDKDEDMESRPPIVTVMGHVDHGKTSLLDFIRKANVIAGEAGGITQHIGAYSVSVGEGRKITFLDTPGHEAFTAMRARGASVTDVAIIVIAADDSVMPQTIEAINHASAAGVPIIFAINKIDKAGANPDRIREQLAAMNYLVEDWGGKYQCQEIAAKSGLNVDELLEKVILEADILELKANPNKKAVGAVVESSLDKGRGYVTTLLVQSGTLRVGDVMLSGICTGRVKAMFNERGKRIEEATPSTPVSVLGLNGAPQAGDKFNVMDDDKQARDIANKRQQLQRIQGLKTQKHITLDEIGRRIAIGNFQELNIIVKGDVDGSVEALTDSLIKQSHAEVQVNVIHKAVGQISESDVLLAAASNAVIIGFQVRPSVAARKLAEKEEIEIRQYSIIYDAINEIKSAIEGMLAPTYKENVVCSVEVMDVFKITKVGSVAGCMVREGKINRNTLIRIIRDGIVIYTGKLGSLKRYKDDAKEVVTGLECGLNIENYNDIKVGDIIEGYEQIEIKRS